MLVRFIRRGSDVVSPVGIYLNVFFLSLKHQRSPGQGDTSFNDDTGDRRNDTIALEATSPLVHRRQVESDFGGLLRDLLAGLVATLSTRANLITLVIAGLTGAALNQIRKAISG